MHDPTRNTALAALLLLAAGPLSAQQIGDPDCERLLLVSSFESGNVRIYDACDGSFIRDLDDDNRLEGVLAVVEGPDGDLYVASESNNRVVQYDRQTLSYTRVVSGDRPETPEIEAPALVSPSGLAFTEEGRLYGASFNQNTIVEIDLNDGSAARFLATGADGINGPDAGIGVQGNVLLVPNFNGNDVVRVDTVSGTSGVFIPAGTPGLSAPRTVLVQDDGNLLVSSWRGNRILEFNASGGLIRTVSEAANRPTGIGLESDDVLLVTSDAANDVKRIRLSDGALLDVLVPIVPRGPAGGTFLLLIDKLGTQAVADTGQFWLIGVGDIDTDGRSIQVDDLVFTQGAAFGADFDPDAVERLPWGSLTIEFDACDSAVLNWNANQAPAFGSGSYALQRLAASPLGDLCQDIGLDQVADALWMSGQWYGGAPRSGEGFSVDVINGNRAIVTWYTYLAAD